LASIFKTRIELRQIGVRDEAKLIGGLGICGKPFCCSTFWASSSRFRLRWPRSSRFRSTYQNFWHLRAADVLPEI
jgi:hypothetical protein